MTSVRPTCLIDIIERPGRTICKISGTYDVNDLWPSVVKLTHIRMSRRYRQKENKNPHTPQSFWLSEEKKNAILCGKIECCWHLFSLLLFPFTSIPTDYACMYT